MSQILSGTRLLNEDQAFRLADYLTLGELERNYFLLLVQCERAGSKAYEKHLRDQAALIKAQSEEVRRRVAVQEKVNKEIEAEYYSSIDYALVRLCCSVGRFRTADEIAGYLKKNVKRIRKVMEFLLANQFCRIEGGIIVRGTTNLHLDKASPFFPLRQKQLRDTAIAAIEAENPRDLSFSSMISISNKDFALLRELLLDVITQMQEKVKDSKDETLAVVNIDFFQIPF